MADAAPQPSQQKIRSRRVRTPTVLQMEAVECGAAALGIVLGYHGRIVPLEELRLACGVSRDGSKASNVLKAARKYGLEAKGFKYELDEVLALAFPAIVFWNFNHFVVLEGVRRGKVYLNDPAAGPRVVTLQEFDEGYTGVVLTFAPGPEFRRGGEGRSLVPALLRRVRGSEAAVAFSALAGLALIVPGLVLPVFSQLFVDKILVARLDSWFKPLLIGMGLTVLLRAGLSWIQQSYLLRLETKLALTTSSHFLWHVLRLPIEFYSQRYGGEISARVGLNDTVAAFLASRLAATVIDVLLVLLYAALMLAYDWQLTLAGMTAVAVLMAATTAVNRRRKDGNQRLATESGKAAATLLGGLSTIETLKASGLESDLFARWAGYQAKFINAHQELTTITEIFLSVPPLVLALTNVVVLSLGALHVMNGQLTIGMLVAFQSLMMSFLAPVTNLVQLSSTLQEMHGHMNRIDDVLRYRIDEQTLRESSDEDPGGQIDGALELRDVSFGYSRLEAPLIEGFSLSLPPGSRVALVGTSGSGKSTVAKLVTGLYDPWSGEVRFDGRPRQAFPRRALTNSIAMVDQDIALFAGTVRENVTLWDSTIPESQIVQACKDACIHEDISARNGGYDSLVDEGGANFSGGQRQRLEIARALVGNPRVLVLDEATSALDAVTEQVVDQHLRRRGCTCVIIAHRLSTVRDADEIIVLESGKVVERGTHEQLIDTGGAYARLVQHTA